MKKQHNTKGFTMIELMIVMAIIAIITAIAIPSLMKTKMQSNEAASSGSLKTLVVAQISYRRDFNQYAMDIRDLFGVNMTNYAPHLANDAMYNACIAELDSPDLTVSTQLAAASSTKVPYAGFFYFSNHNYTNLEFMMGCTPNIFNVDGRKSFFTSASSAIYEMDASGAPAIHTADTVAAEYNDAGDWNTDGSGGAGSAWIIAE